MRIKYILLSLLILSGFILFSQNILAQQDSTSPTTQNGVQSKDMILPPDYDPTTPTTNPFIGQNQSYSVTFRGNGEAVINAKIVFSNKGETPLNTIKLRIPKVDAKNLAVYQVIRESRCIKYSEREYDQKTKTYTTPECLEYQDEDYYQSYYSNAKYQKAKTELNIDTLTITLPRNVKPQRSGSFMIYFRAFGYAKKNIFGAYNYTFETLKAEDDVKSLTVGITTDSDLYLKGAKGEVQYRIQEPAFESFGAADLAPAKNASLDRYYNDIGRGTVTKTASNLAPLESYSVKGSYAKSNLGLYAKETLIVIAVILLVLIVLFFAIKLVLKRLGGVKQTTQLVDDKMKPDEAQRVRILLSTMGLSFASSLLIVGYTALIIFISKYGTSFIYGFGTIVTLLIIIISSFMYALLFFGPGVYVGVKKGFAWGIATLVFTILWLIFYLFVVIVVFNLFIQRSYTPPIGIMPLTD